MATWFSCVSFVATMFERNVGLSESAFVVSAIANFIGILRSIDVNKVFGQK